MENKLPIWERIRVAVYKIVLDWDAKSENLSWLLDTIHSSYECEYYNGWIEAADEEKKNRSFLSYIYLLWVRNEQTETRSLEVIKIICLNEFDGKYRIRHVFFFPLRCFFHTTAINIYISSRHNLLTATRLHINQNSLYLNHIYYEKNEQMKKL